MLAALALLLAAAAPSAAQADSAAADRLRADVEFLASDLLEGRDTGSRGYDIAAAYVASQYRAIGLKPGGPGGSWFLQVPLRRAFHAGPAQASIVAGRDTIALGPADFVARPSLTRQVRTIDAPLVFVGHGISDPVLGIDDYAGLDLRGKIAVAIEGAPPGLPNEIAAHLDSAKEATAAAKGAAGLIEIAQTGRRPGVHRFHLYGQPLIDWAEPSGKAAGQTSRPELAGAISRKVAEKLFAAAGKDLRGILAAAARPGTLAGFALPARLRLSDRTTWQNFTSPEVIGVLPGTDPALRHEHVVLMAHLDHLGPKQNASPGEDRIYNGAIDNAAGVATMLEAARKFAASGKPPRRSVLFIANTAEEVGLRGADYFASNPTVPLHSIAAVVDLDMPVLLYEFTDVIAFGGEHSTLARHIAGSAASMGVAVSADPMPDEAIFVRSDHYRFVTRGIPAVLLMTGYANGGEAKWKEFLAAVYHRPGDDAEQPIRWDQGARYAELSYRIARALADAGERPLWYKGDYFGEAFAPAQPKADR
jgi:hypothetical protein